MNRLGGAAFPLLGILLAALATPIPGQDLAADLAVVPAADPGGVATIVVRLEGSAPDDTLTYSLRPSQGVRLFSRATGTVVPDLEGRSLLPFTVGIPADAPAGSYTVGRLTVLSGEGDRKARDLRVGVAARRDVGFWIGVDTTTTTAGEMLEFGYRLHNRGNAVDTFRIGVVAPESWSRLVLPQQAVLAPGDTAVGRVQLIPPGDAAGGRQQLVRVTVDGAGVRRTVSATVVVVSEESWLGDLAQIPGSIFVGSSSGVDGAPGIGLRAAGSVGSGTRVSLALRHSEAAPVPTAFRGALSGPRLRLAIDAADWTLHAGEIFVPGTVFMGPAQAGRGAAATLERGSLSGRVRLAAPGLFGVVTDEGHLFETAAGIDRPYGRIGVQLSSVERRSSFLEDYALLGGGMDYSLHHGEHDVKAEAGLLRVRTDSASRTGFAASADYRRRWDGGIVAARLRLTPGTTARTASQAREALLSGTVDLLPGVAATGWALASSAPRITGEPHSAEQGAALGVRLHVPGDATVQIMGRQRHSEHVGGTRPSTLRRSILTTLEMPLGAFWLESSADLGTLKSDHTRPYRSVRAGFRWNDRREWAWLGASHYDSGLGVRLTTIDLTGALEFLSAELQAGVNVDLGAPDIADAVSMWSAFTRPVASRYEISTGIDYRGGGLEPWRFSLGVSRRIGLPLPLARSPFLHGVVYEDVDGDRVHDPEEPVLAGVEVAAGALRTTTNEKGRFRFHDDGRGALRLSHSTLPPGFAIPVDVALPSSGSVDIPVIRTASLALRIFLDRDADGTKDEVESMAVGAVVSVVDPQGRTRDATTNHQGQVRFGNLPPGDYVVRVYPRGDPDSISPPFETPLQLEPGAALEQTFAVPLRRREIRMPDSSVKPPPTPLDRR